MSGFSAASFKIVMFPAAVKYEYIRLYGLSAEGGTIDWHFLRAER
jgi:hypothetical protein